MRNLAEVVIEQDELIREQENKIKNLTAFNDVLNEVVQCILGGVTDVVVSKSKKHSEMPATEVKLKQFLARTKGELALNLTREIIINKQYTEFNETIDGSGKVVYSYKLHAISLKTLKELQPLQTKYNSIKQKLGM